MEREFDVVVVGAGPAGEIAAGRVAERGGTYQARLAADRILGEEVRARGTTRFVVDAERELLIGATFVGPDVVDLLQAATVAVVGRVPLRTLTYVIAPFPARSELWLKFIEAYEQRREQHGLAGSLHAETTRRVAMAA